MYTYKLTISYDGTAYHGWQIQPNGSSIQQILRDILQVILRVDSITLIGAGRTDAGVHAIGQVAHFRHEELVDLLRLQRSLNGMLPRDIRIKAIDLVQNDFHAQYSAKGKEYHYHLYMDPVMDPFRRLYCWHVTSKIDIELLKQAATLFVGEHDFTTFANEAHEGSASRDPIRTLSRLDVVAIEGGIRLEFEADGFLYRMVRNITGTLVVVALGKKELSEIKSLFESRDRRKAGAGAPPQGLFLYRVNY